jgi:hypothetical protein
MPTLRTYRLFISHAWKYNTDYYNLIGLLDKAPNFQYANYSVPEHDPALDPEKSTSRAKLTAALDEQIRQSQCVLIISGMYVNHSFWIQTEIDIASGYQKPIIGLIPRGQEKTPKAVQDVAKEMVGWTTDSIVSAIRSYSL